MGDRYRVTINGWRCVHESFDDMLQRDGKRDEVYIYTETRIVKPDGVMLDAVDVSVSKTMGDTWRLPNRVKAGNADKVWGGIQSGDQFPDNPEPWNRSNTPLRTDLVPPYIVWEGEVSDDYVVFITPELWEWDDGRSWMEELINWHKETDAQYGEAAKKAFGTVFPVAAPVFDIASVVIKTVGTLVGLWAPFGTSQTRPLGMQRDPANPEGFKYEVTSIGLTPESAKRLSQYRGAHGVGVLTREFRDDPKKLLGHYILYVQVEALTGAGPTAQPVIPVQHGWLWCSKCQGLFFGGLQVNSVCPAGGRHSTQMESGSGAYAVPHGAPDAFDRQAGWSWCDRCQGLFWGRAWETSICPAGGKHSDPAVSKSGAYSLFHNAVPDPDRQEDWRWCSACQGLFFGGMQAASVCPAGGKHVGPNQSGSGNYAIAHQAP